MNLVAADSQGGSRVLADVVVADPTRSTAVMVTAVERRHAARLAAPGGGDEGWEVRRSLPR
jgi:hypothetical protein